MKISPSLLLSWAEVLSDPAGAAKQLSSVKPVGKIEILEKVIEIGRLLSTLISRAFSEKARGAMKELQSASAALDELHSSLLDAPEIPFEEGRVGSWGLFCVLAFSILSEVKAELNEVMASSSLAPDVLASWSSSLTGELKGLSALLELARVPSPGPPGLEFLRAISTNLPRRKDLAAMWVLLGHAPELRKDKKAFPELLATLVERGMIRRGEGTRDGCLRLLDVISWTSRLLGLRVEPGEAKAALQILKARGVLSYVDEELGIALLRPREEDIRAAFEVARERCKHARARVSASSLVEHFGWRPEYASAVIGELAARGLLIANSDKWLPVSEEQARSLLIEAESCFEAELLGEASRIYQMAATLFTKLSEKAQGHKLELLLAEASYCDFMKAYCDALMLMSSLRRAAVSGLALDVGEIDKLKLLVRTASKCLNETLRRVSRLIEAGVDKDISRAASEIVERIGKRADKFKEFREEVESL